MLGSLPVSLITSICLFQTEEGGSATNGTFLQDIQKRQMEVIRDTGSDPNIPVDWLGAPVLDFSAGESG
jgi:hypothetical protein